MVKSVILQNGMLNPHHIWRNKEEWKQLFEFILFFLAELTTISDGFFHCIFKAIHISRENTCFEKKEIFFLLLNCRCLHQHIVNDVTHSLFAACIAGRACAIFFRAFRLIQLIFQPCIQKAGRSSRIEQSILRKTKRQIGEKYQCVRTYDAIYDAWFNFQIFEQVHGRQANTFNFVDFWMIPKFLM